MKAIKAAVLLAALNTAPVAIPAMGTAGLLASTTTAEACTPGVNCNMPTPVGKGKKAPTWKVLYCVTGPEGGPYTPIACDDPRAVHRSPKGLVAVCFFGSDGKLHWDFPGIVYEGRTFKNLVINENESEPIWKLTAAEKARLGIK